MAVFGCAGCGAALTVAVSRVVRPVHLADSHWEMLHPPLLEAGTYAVDHERFGAPWRTWEEVGAAEAAARGYFVEFWGNLSDGPPDTLLFAPGDLPGTALIPERNEGHCLGIDGSGGPNLACLDCGRPVGWRIDDCGQWQVARLLPEAVRLPGPPERPVMDWAELTAEGALWPGLGEYRHIPAGVALAHAVVATGGGPVVAAPGPVAGLFGRALAALLPAGTGATRLDLAGPGLGEPDAELVLVPVHPQTGEVWRPGGGAVPVPVEAALWAELAFPVHRTRLPAVGGLPPGVERDDPLPPHPPARPSGNAYRYTVARLPVGREPWLRALHARWH
ncbi:hypothetical protein [Streptomyces sp. NPDC088557]|uniref:hypothetical protein n=1 Tax=Streptomyces sp. NPDC088557 TaxID=3365867 RepID=UPI00381170DE